VILMCWRPVRNLILLAGLAGGMTACSGSSSEPMGGSPLAPSTLGEGAGTRSEGTGNVLVFAQSRPHAVFRTVPVADSDDTIRGLAPLLVQFNNCQSRPAEEDDDLKFTYDFDGDGTVDELGHCRWEHTYTAPATARVCVSDRRGNDVCQAWEIRPHSIPPEPDPVPTPGPVVTVGAPPSATWTSISIACGSLTTDVTLRVTDPDGHASTWTAAVSGGTLTSPASGGPVASGGLVTVRFVGTRGLNVVRLDLVDSTGVRSVPVSRFGPSNTCGGQVLQILG
jgi:hypothetical protein